MTDKTPQSPYINTTLISPIMLYPNQMDNKIYLHLFQKGGFKIGLILNPSNSNIHNLLQELVFE